MTISMSKEQIDEEVRRFKHWEWGYNFNGVRCRPNNPRHEALQKVKIGHIFSGIRSHLEAPDGEQPLAGLRVLDVGCNEGLFSITARQMGARYALGLEPRPEKVEQARFTSHTLGIDQVEFQEKSLWDITEEIGSFDITLLIGVLYHLDRPFEALRRLADVTKQLIVIDTELLPLDYPLLAMKEEDPLVPYNTVDSGLTFIPTDKSVHLMLGYSGFTQSTKIVPRGPGWKANSYTRHYIDGHRGTFIARRSRDAIQHRLWPQGVLHPPNRVHSTLFHSMLKPGFLLSSIANDLARVKRRVVEALQGGFRE